MPNPIPEQAEQSSLNTVRIAVLLAFLALFSLAGLGIWWFTRDYAQEKLLHPATTKPTPVPMVHTDITQNIKNLLDEPTATKTAKSWAEDPKVQKVIVKTMGKLDECRATIPAGRQTKSINIMLEMWLDPQGEIYNPTIGFLPGLMLSLDDAVRGEELRDIENNIKNCLTATLKTASWDAVSPDAVPPPTSVRLSWPLFWPAPTP